MKAIFLFQVFLFGLCATPKAQDWDDDDYSVTTTRWRWQYYPITEVVRKDGMQIVKVLLNYQTDYKLENGLRSDKVEKSSVVKQVVNYTLPPGQSDSFAAWRPLKRGDTKLVNIKLPLVKAIFTEDRKDYKKLIEYRVPEAADQVIVAGDLAAFEIEDNVYNDSLLFYRLGVFCITLMDIGRKPYFSELQYWKTPAREMEAVKVMLADLKEGAAFYKDKLKAAFMQTGPYTGKTVSEILAAATEIDIIHCVYDLLSRPREFMGRKVKFAEAYADWIAGGGPKAATNNMKLVEEFDKWVRMQPISVNADAGTVNGIALKKALANWKNYFPWYDGDETEYPEHLQAPYWDYNLLGNSLTYYPSQKALKVILANHSYGRIFDLKEFSVKEITQKLGKPARVIGNPKSPEALLYARTFGTIEFRFTYHESAVLVYLYPAPPAQVKRADTE